MFLSFKLYPDFTNMSKKYQCFASILLEGCFGVAGEISVFGCPGGDPEGLSQEERAADRRAVAGAARDQAG